MSAGGSIGMVLDRALTVDLFDVALRIATEHRGDPGARQLLTVALRDLVTRQEAENKTRKILTRVWVAPPDEAKPMIEWAVDHQDRFTDRRALHYGALLSTFPFVGSITAAMGRQLRLDGSVDRRAVRIHARTTFGEREFIDAGASKTLATLRNLKLLEGPKNGPFTLGSKPKVPDELSPWFLHALILTRQAESASVGELSYAHELEFVDIAASSSPYPLLDLHTEGDRSVAVEMIMCPKTPTTRKRAAKAASQLALDLVDESISGDGASRARA